MTTSSRTGARGAHGTTDLTRRGVLAGGLGAVLAGALAACGSTSGAGSAASSPSPSVSSPAASATPSASASAEATSQALTAQESAQDPEAAWTEGHSESEPSGRVVVQTSGTGTIGWFADVVDEASTQGKGDPLSLEGSHLIRVYGRGTQMPMTEQDQQIDYDGPALVNAGGTALKQVYLDRTFEDQFQLVLGTESTQYRVFTLSEPSRLVIDVRQP